MSNRVLVLGATGTLGRPVARHLAECGHEVRVLARSAEKARCMFGPTVEVVEGDSVDRERVRKAMKGCDAVHISLPPESELVGVQHVVYSAAVEDLERISYVSATSVCEENRWFEIVDVKLRAEETLRRSGVPHTVFRPTWVMEVLPNFVKRNRAVVILGRNPPGLHFFAAADFARMVATAHGDEKTIGKRLYIHGPESITLPDALRTFIATCYPQHKILHLKLWQASLIARLTRQMDFVTRLIGFFDRVGELGDPTEANALLGAPATTLSEWIESQTAAC